MRILLFLFILIPSLARASAQINLADFSHAERAKRQPEVVVNAHLSPAGIEKFKKLSRSSVGQRLKIEVGGVKSDFVLREPIKDGSIEMGPYSEADATRVIKAINGQ